MKEGSVGSMEPDDGISRLPDEVRELILGYMPITDAVRTSVLSQKWRDSWTRAGQLNLVFDDEVEEEMSEDKYCRLVGRIFLSHVGTVRKCGLRPLWHYINNELRGWEYLEGDMKTWLQCLARKGIEDLTIHLRKDGFNDDDFLKFDLPRSIFQCLGLSCLSLEHFVLTNSVAVRGFPNLVKLELSGTLIEADVLQKIVSSSPLETLVIKDCVLASRKNAIKSSSLKILKIVRTFNENWPIILKFTPNLRVASFVLDVLDDEADVLLINSLYIFRRIPKIEELTFDCRLLKTAYPDVIPEKLPKLLVNLKTMTLDNLDVLSQDDKSFLYCIIRSSPNLQKLTICLKHCLRSPSTEDSLKDVTASREAEDIEEIRTNITTLSVAFSSFDIGEHIGGHIALIDCLVSCCPNLDKLFIKSPPSLSAPADRLLTNALPKFGQYSSKLTIIIHTKAY